MHLDNTLIHIIAVAAVIAAFLVFVAYYMAAWGTFNDTHFGRAVFYTGIPVWGFAALVHGLAPNILRDLNITTGELVLYATGIIAFAGACGFVFDAVAWLFGKDDPQ